MQLGHRSRLSSGRPAPLTARPPQSRPPVLGPASELNRAAEGTLERLSMGAAESCALPVGFTQRVRKPHDTPRIVAVRELVGVSELVNGFGGRAVHEPIAVACVKPGSRKDGDSSPCIGFSEHEVQVRRTQINIGDAELPLDQNLSARRRAELERAKRILQRRAARQKAAAKKR
jgi:hypothetical protein